MLQEIKSASGTAPFVKVAFVVTEFPKTTETFVLRDIVEFGNNGCEITIFSLTHFNRMELLHDFAGHTQTWARDYAYFFSSDVIGALIHFLRARPRDLGQVVSELVRGARSDPVMLLKSLFILPKSLRIARELERWGADHVHAAFAGHPATAAWIIGRMTGIPFSVSSHAHDLFESQALLAEKLPDAAFVRTISDYNRRFILEHVPKLAHRPPEVIHVGTYQRDARRVPLEQIEGFRILYTGSLERRKGVDLLLRALAEAGLEDWCLEVIGDGPERSRLERLARELGLAKRIEFRGSQPNEAVFAAMLRSSVLVVPSRIGPRNQTEGLPTVIVEAYAAELPVIATRLTGIPEIVRHESTGLLFEMEDANGLAAALRRMQEDPARAAEWAAAGHALVKREFDQAANARALLDLVLESVRPRSVQPVATP